MPLCLPRRDLELLEGQVRAAFDSGDPCPLDVLGYGESTVVLRLDTAYGAFACKRLPTFPSRDRFELYQQLLARYLRRLAGGGLRILDTEVHHQVLPSGEVAAYCVQEALPADRLCSALLHTAGTAWAHDFFERFLTAVDRVVTPALGLDAQASNWFDIDGELVFLDVTTPFIRDEHGREQLDVRLFVSSLPWLLRDPVRLSMTSTILDKFYAPRGIILDFLGNLYKEELGALMPAFLQQANARLQDPISSQEVTRYYARDARTWQLIQRLRRADRFWQQKIRRRPYCFLLPPEMAR